MAPRRLARACRSFDRHPLSVVFRLAGGKSVKNSFRVKLFEFYREPDVDGDLGGEFGGSQRIQPVRRRPGSDLGPRLAIWIGASGLLICLALGWVYKSWQ